MGYCGICNKHGVTSEKVEGGYYCSGCDEIHYYDQLDKQNAEKTLEIIKRAKANGANTYGMFDEDINEALKNAEAEVLRYNR
jgi:hypothetical protein